MTKRRRRNDKPEAALIAAEATQVSKHQAEKDREQQRHLLAQEQVSVVMPLRRLMQANHFADLQLDTLTDFARDLKRGARPRTG